jgi:hypothetical protein
MGTMNLRDAKAQIERDRPELTGTEKLQAIKELRQQTADNQRAAAPTGHETTQGVDAFCQNCQQKVKPTVHNGWGKFFTFLALLELVAVVVSVVAVFHRTHFGGGAIARLVLWPELIRPSGVGVVAAVAAFLAVVGVAGNATQRAERASTCPKCHSVLATQAG